MIKPSLASSADVGASVGLDQPFAFRNSAGRVCASGPGRALARGTRENLADRLAPFFSGPPDGAVIGGALPFDTTRPDCLWQAAGGDGIWPGDAVSASHVARFPVTRPRPQPPARGYIDSVARALEIMRSEDGLPEALQKIVLARTLLIEDAQAFSMGAILARASEDPSVTAFQVSLPARADQVTPRHLVGATPELLLQKRGAVILSHPLAGSARRQESPQADAEAAQALVQSEKDQREHRLVVEYILDLLAPDCAELSTPEGTALTTTRSMWHIGTRITGRLKDPDTPAVVLAARLHPTPAVCGLPCARAASLIRSLEPIERDFYAGAVGWCDRHGDGDWYVAIRCAELCGAQARLYAGAGIVLGSEPRAEAAETSAKFGALLAALGLPRDAALHDLDLRHD
ncbi:isochorismate synthase [Rhodobacter sp. TJ_12]|uniref:isochorismate synthase n=1 Tax=Rhodobacter sp. TJ_12 TaxID=2029399 RepID=UPI001CBCBC06|nr:isochorismate synthase [Rhodobacter sp. TJ_12]MBZ4023730.1 isochorismate synthase [Rhodobacter sp. TJ_12]